MSHDAAMSTPNGMTRFSVSVPGHRVLAVSAVPFPDFRVRGSIQAKICYRDRPNRS
jgi:hypothetical protein